VGALPVPLAIVALAGSVLLQIPLARRGSRWLGLILPLVWFCVALAAAGYQIREWSAVTGGAAAARGLGWEPAAAAAFLAASIPTAVLLAISCACRR